MALFKMPERPGKAADVKAAKKAKTTAKKSAPTARSGTGVLERITQIKALVNQNLGKYADRYDLITDIEDLREFIDICISNGVISIDTETTGLDPIQDKIAGLCLYTPKCKAVYVPINHVSYVTGQRTSNQLTEEQCGKELERLVYNRVKVIMFNAAFDIRVIRNQLGVYLTCYWDCYLGARCLNENEPENRLKVLHNKYCLDGKGDAWTFDSLFKGITFTNIPPSTGYLYAARDAEITYELYEFQKPYLTESDSVCIEHGLQGVAWVFRNIEMPCIEPICNMEDNGITFDFKRQKELSVKYNSLLQEKKEKCMEMLERDRTAILKAHSQGLKIDFPVNLSSPTQLAVYLYDILKIPLVDSKSPRGTGEAILRKMDTEFTRTLVEYKKFEKLVSAFVDSLPKWVNPNDGKIHCKFNQYGADTGRMSCQDPNLQQIPSHTKDIRNMFKAQEGYVLMSSDYSQQEPKCLAAMCAQQGDAQMLDTFLSGKDLYSEIASKAFNVPYEQCKEFNSDGTTNVEGKERRTQAKSILLGVLYGRGTASIAEQLKCTPEKAQDIKDSVFRAFPAIEKFEQDSKDMAYEKGYVTTLCGRKRRLLDYSLPEFEFEYVGGVCPDSDLLDFDSEPITEVPETVCDRYYRALKRARFNEKRNIIEKARQEGILIRDNGGKIADAERQCVNARIQGSAADLTKLALISLNKNQRLKKLGFRLLIPVHDEVISECPEENKDECSKLLAEVMSTAAEKILKMPIKCDVDITHCWYERSVDE